MNSTSPLQVKDTPSSAKAHLLAWAEEHDARKARAKTSIGTVVVGSAIAVVSGIAVARMLSPRRSGGSRSRVMSVGKQLISWALVARAGRWLLPLAIGAVQRNLQRRTASSPSARTQAATTSRTESAI